jgi:DNA-binding CsgD family transcriptional regulator
LLVTARDAAAGAGDELGMQGPDLHLVELECRAGNLSRARTYADEGVAILDEGIDAQTLGAALYGRALVAAHEGEVELTRALAERGVRMGQAVGDRIFPMLNLAVLGMLELSLGDGAAALGHLESLPELYRQLGYHEPGRAPFEPDRIEALIAVGRHHEAEPALAAWERLGHELNRPRVLATAARARGLLAAARGDVPTALTALGEAFAHHAGLPDPHERARSLLVLGATLRRAGRRRQARDALAEAQTTFQKLGEAAWAGRASSEAGRLGGRAPGGEELTPTEHRVAGLVAEGRSNREVADALYITVRTVEANLTRIYAKLGVRSRAQLIARRRTDSSSTSGAPRNPAETAS